MLPGLSLAHKGCIFKAVFSSAFDSDRKTNSSLGFSVFPASHICDAFFPFAPVPCYIVLTSGHQLKWEKASVAEPSSVRNTSVSFITVTGGPVSAYGSGSCKQNGKKSCEWRMEEPCAWLSLRPGHVYHKLGYMEGSWFFSCILCTCVHHCHAWGTLP